MINEQKLISNVNDIQIQESGNEKNERNIVNFAPQNIKPQNINSYIQYQTELQNYEGFIQKGNKIIDIEIKDLSQHPFNKIVLIMREDQSSFGTGTLLRKNKILTCAHLFHGQIYSNFMVTIFSSQTSYSIFDIYICPNFIYGDHSVIGNANDWAVITLNNVERTPHQNPILQANFDKSNGSLFIIGYSLVSQFPFHVQLQKSECSIPNIQIDTYFEQQISYQATTFFGWSGSPLIQKIDGNFKIIGIHTGTLVSGISNKGIIFNEGQREMIIKQMDMNTSIINFKTNQNQGACFRCLKFLSNKYKKHDCKIPIDIYRQLQGELLQEPQQIKCASSDKYEQEAKSQRVDIEAYHIFENELKTSIKKLDQIIQSKDGVELSTIKQIIFNQSMSVNRSKSFMRLWIKYQDYCIQNEFPILHEDSANQFLRQFDVEDKFASTTINKKKYQLERLLQGVTKTNIKLFKSRKIMRKHIIGLNESQIQNLLDEAMQNEDGDIYRCCLFIYEEGSRISAVSNLICSHFELQQKRVWIPETKCRPHLQKLKPKVLEVFKPLLAILQPSDYVFMTERKLGRINTLTKRVNKFLQNSQYLDQLTKDIGYFQRTSTLFRQSLATQTYNRRNAKYLGKARKAIGHTYGSTAIQNYLGELVEYDHIPEDEKILKYIRKTRFDGINKRKYKYELQNPDDLIIQSPLQKLQIDKSGSQMNIIQESMLDINIRSVIDTNFIEEKQMGGKDDEGVCAKCKFREAPRHVALKGHCASCQLALQTIKNQLKCESCEDVYHNKKECFGINFDVQPSTCDDCFRVILKNCNKCKKGYHYDTCFRENEGSLGFRSYCQDCRSSAIKDLQDSSSSISIHFQSQCERNSYFSTNYTKNNSDDPQLLYVVSKSYMTDKDRKELIIAMSCRNMVFDDNLFYSTDHLFKSNNSLLQSGRVPIMNNANLKSFEKFKSDTQKGLYPPIYIQEEEGKGFCIRARDKILQNTLITEYTGEVKIGKYSLTNTDDDNMCLLKSHSSYLSLTILPSKRGNIARFINGAPSSQSKRINVKPYTISINGQNRIILLASRLIEKDEELLYYYGKDYPNKGFK